MQTRKHFQQMADMLKTIQDVKHRVHLARMNAVNFAKENPRFDSVRFFSACNLPENVDTLQLSDINPNDWK
tara:strand:+ start:366 stop:578 length:213 start_codon:yes stop_codon:yes gene_type:complete